MKFNGHDYPLNQRSGLDLSADGPMKFKQQAELDFYIRLHAPHLSNYGYVFRLLLGDQNVDLIHGIVMENPNNFELILGDQTSKVAFYVSEENLLREWLHIHLKFDTRAQEIICTVNGEEYRDAFIGYEDEHQLRLVFGAHSLSRYSSTDVPSMVIRDVRLKSQGKSLYHWPLDETQGNRVHSVPEGQTGVAMHPSWLLKKHNTWATLFQLQEEGWQRTAFDAVEERLYLVSSDSVRIYDMRDGVMTGYGAKLGSPEIPTEEILFDQQSGRLMCYSVDRNTLSYFDPQEVAWLPPPLADESLTSFYHHNRFLDSLGTLHILGGYGYHTYKNELLRWDDKSSAFMPLDYQGTFLPRYLAGSGYNKNDGKLYILGGYGSRSGKQSESPDYYRDLLSYSPEDRRFESLHEFTGYTGGFCFANSLVISPGNNIYGLSFNKIDFENQLQLIQIPLSDPKIVKVGNPIPFTFLDIQSNVDLFYSKSTNTLLACASYMNEQGESKVSVHSIAFPPQPFEEDVYPEEKQGGTAGLRYGILVLLGLVVLAIPTYFLLTRKRKPEIKVVRESSQQKKKNAIILFGGFQVIDGEGNDITGQFTPLPKKLFLYILLHSLRNGKGVSSNSLYETFWFDKSVESARNNRAVNIVKLKSLLDNLEGTSISKETGYWKFDFDPGKVHIDYFHYLQIIHQEGDFKKKDMQELLGIVENSPFLNNTNAEWLDPFKSDVSNEIIDTILKYISSSKDDPEFLLHLINCIFVFDAVSEEALKVQCRLLIKQGKHSLAKSAYSKFINEYELLYGEKYGLSFNQLIE